LLALFPPLPEGFELDWLDRGDGTRTAMTGGQGGDRSSLRLRAADEGLVLAVAAANRRTAVAVVAAGAVLTGAWRGEVPALVLMWYAGMEGGHALADVLTGRHNPSGRLPFAIPTSEEHLPAFDREATSI